MCLESCLATSSDLDTKLTKPKSPEQGTRNSHKDTVVLGNPTKSPAVVEIQEETAAP